MTSIPIPGWLLAKPEYQQAFALGFRAGWGYRPLRRGDASIWRVRFTHSEVRATLQAMLDGTAGMNSTTGPLGSGLEQESY